MRRDDDAERGHDDRPAAALDLHRHGERTRRRATSPRRCGRSARRRTSASSRRSRPGSTTVCRVCRVSERSACSTTSRRRRGQQHLADAGRVQRQPAADLADHRHRLAAGDPLDVERGEPLPDGQVDGVADRGVHVEQERAPRPGAAPSAPAPAGRGPRACGRSRSGRRTAGRGRPSRRARPSSRCAVVSGVPERSAISDSDSRGEVAVEGVEEGQGAGGDRPSGRRAAAGHGVLLPPSGSPGLGSVTVGRTVAA